MNTYTIGDATVTVEYDGKCWSAEDSGYRQRYSYTITTPDWQYVGNDIQSGCGARVDVEDAARTLFSFLSACAEARQYTRERRLAPAENDDLFPDHVGQWAEDNSDELSILSLDPEDMDR